MKDGQSRPGQNTLESRDPIRRRDQGSDRLPPFNVLLHNDDVHDMEYVVGSLVQITPLDPARASAVMLRAHMRGVACVLTTHKERAELYRDQFRSKGLLVTIEPGAA